MKIWHLIHQYLPEKIGGTELYTRNVATMQGHLGHEVTVITPSSDAHEIPDPGESRNFHASLPRPRLWRFPFGKRSPLQVFLTTWRGHSAFEKWFAQALTVDQPDIVHIEHLMGIPLAVVDQIVAEGIPYVITLHDFWGMCTNGQLLTNYDRTVCPGPDPNFVNCGRCLLARAGLPAPPVFGQLTGRAAADRAARIKPVLNRARRLIAPTRFVREMFLISGQISDPNRIILLPHGIEIPVDFDFAAANSESGFRIAYIGGLSEQKGLHILIEAFNQLPAGAKLDLYGDELAFPGYVDRLKKLAVHPGITFHGRVPHEQIWSIFGQADLAAVPTLWYETFSFVVDEAMAAGTPVVASHIGVMAEKIQDGVNGRLIPTGDVQAWHEVLLELYERPERIKLLRAGITPPPFAVKPYESPPATLRGGLIFPF